MISWSVPIEVVYCEAFAPASEFWAVPLMICKVGWYVFQLGPNEALFARLKQSVYAQVVDVNVAVALLSASIVSAQVVAVPEQAPVQPVNEAPACGCAVKVTEAPGGL